MKPHMPFRDYDVENKCGLLNRLVTGTSLRIARTVRGQNEFILTKQRNEKKTVLEIRQEYKDE